MLNEVFSADPRNFSIFPVFTTFFVDATLLLVVASCYIAFLDKWTIQH